MRKKKKNTFSHKWQKDAEDNKRLQEANNLHDWRNSDLMLHFVCHASVVLRTFNLNNFIWSTGSSNFRLPQYLSIIIYEAIILSKDAYRMVQFKGCGPWQDKGLMQALAILSNWKISLSKPNPIRDLSMKLHIKEVQVKRQVIQST